MQLNIKTDWAYFYHDEEIKVAFEKCCVKLKLEYYMAKIFNTKDDKNAI